MDKDLEIQQSEKCAKWWANQNRKWVAGGEKPVEEPWFGCSEESLRGRKVVGKDQLGPNPGGP